MTAQDLVKKTDSVQAGYYSLYQCDEHIGPVQEMGSALTARAGYMCHPIRRRWSDLQALYCMCQLVMQNLNTQIHAPLICT